MDETVPLMIPEINADHLKLLDRQQAARGWKGRIVTNPNCSVIALTLALAPLRQFGLKSAMVTTLQAISGAGYPGVASWDILGNVIPFIGGEEEKFEPETQKILGSIANGAIQPHPVVVSATATRVPVRDGHTVSASVKFDQKVAPDAVIAAFNGFRGRPQELKLPSAPPQPLVYLAENHRPQPALDVDRGGGMAVTVGRLRPCPCSTTSSWRSGTTRSWRRGRRDSQRRADAPGRVAVSRHSTVVMKFGGTSVADVAAMTRVIDIVRSQWKSQDDGTRPPVVVVSALSKVTDGLIRAAECARAGDEEKAADLVGGLLGRHIGIAMTLTRGQQEDLQKALREQFAWPLGERVMASALKREVTPADATPSSRWASWRAA